MKRWIHAATDLNILNHNGIDTTVSTYQMKAKDYDTDEDYTIQFKCSGDYLAYLAMGKLDPSIEGLIDYFGSIDEALSCCHNEDAMKQFASKYWWGDGGDFKYYLKNLTTGEYLYGPETL